MKSSVKQDIMQRHERVFSAEYGIDAKSFFNLYRRLYCSGDLVQSLRLIRPKHFVGVGRARIDIPTNRDPKHYVAVSVQSQNDLKKNLGLTVLKISDHFMIDPTLLMRNSLLMKTSEWSYTLMFQKHWFNNLFAIKLSNEFKSGEPFNPHIGFISRQLSPFVLKGDLNIDRSFSFSVSKEETPNSRFGY